jgi:hypothetical protein
MLPLMASRICWSVGGRVLEQRRGLHDLAGLAVAALRHVELAPCLLHRMIAVSRQALDGDDGLAVDVADLDLAGAHGRAFEMHGAGAAQRPPAAELGAGHAGDVAQIPEKRRLRVAAEVLRFAIDGELAHGWPPRGDDERSGSRDSAC